MGEDPVTGLDGTYEPAPPPLLADPLSGLVTGVNLRRDEIPLVAPPKLPDVDEIRAAVAAALAQESQPPPEPPTPTPTREPREAPGIMPPIRQWPAAAAVARRLRATKDRPPSQAPELPRKPASVRTGISVVIVIVLVTVVLLYYVISSLADTIGKLF